MKNLMLIEKKFGVIFTNPKLPILDYKTSDKNLDIGSLVEVPLGSKVALGIIWNFGNTDYNISSLRDIIRPVNDIKLTNEFIQFLIKAHSYTLSPIQSFLKMAVQNISFHKETRCDWRYKLLREVDTKYTSKQTDLISFIKIQPGKEATFKKIKSETGISKYVVNKLVESNVLLKTRDIKENIEILHQHKSSLSTEQNRAFSFVKSKISIPGFQSWLLYGVTGSGKTEVYLKIAREYINQGMQVLILLPEISLTIDFIQRINKLYGNFAGEWHSQLTLNSRRRVFENVLNGRLKILVGARSALFLPFRKLGLIIVDEEHDSSYKQEERPIYNARDLAVLRASSSKIKVILSSATPSIETWHNCKTGKYNRVDIRNRFGSAREPVVSLINMNLEHTKKNSWISLPIIDEIKKSLQKKQQVLIFLNRRGYSPVAFCRKCKISLECKNCTAKLVYHKAKSIYLCHMCGYRVYSAKCSGCGLSDSLIPIGPGVERIRDEITNLFPDFSSTILSSDIFSNRKNDQAIIEKIKSGETNIIVGTQLVSKGYNFPNLKLVAVIDADMGLNTGDHRVMEKSYQVIKQVVGRAGRYSSDGRAFIQTWMPTHPVLQALLHGKGEEFLNTELSQRFKANVPPYSRFISIILSGKQEKSLLTYGIGLKKDFFNLDLKGWEIFGPAIAPIAKIKNKQRVRLLIRSVKNCKISQLEIRDWLKNVSVPNNINFSVDIDPYTFY